MDLILSSAVMVANDNGNIITVGNLGNEYQNLSDSLTFRLKKSVGNFAMPINGRIVYQGSEPIESIVCAKFSMFFGSVGSSLGIALYKNGVQIEESISLDCESPEIMNFPVSLSNNDYIEVWANSSQLLKPAELIQCQFSIFNMTLI
jgi:hypothetical protein